MRDHTISDKLLPKATPGKSPVIKVTLFFTLLFVTTGLTYFAPTLIKDIFYLTVLFFYFRSKNEAFWLAYFLVLSDGFFGFFGIYGAVLEIIPGLPPVEMGQLYILLTLVKTFQKKLPYRSFYKTPLQILLVYLVFLIIQGYIVGLDSALNVQFRIVKMMIPLLLLYTIPRLFNKVEQYKEIFLYLFPIAFVALGAQVFSITVGQTPPQFFGIDQKLKTFVFEVTEEKTYRGFYNYSIMIITYFGALFFLAFKPHFFKSGYLYSVIIAILSAVFLSATRGWILSFTFILVVYFVFILRTDIKRIFILFFVGVFFFIGAQAVPVLKMQVNNSFKRILTLEALVHGDITAGGTLVRLSKRGPRVINKWKDSKLTGFGFSNDFFGYFDIHVGNHSILLHSGIIGILLMYSFFLFFMVKTFFRAQDLPINHPAKGALILFALFLFGWILLHSSSEQFFAFYHERPGNGMIQAIFFSMAGLVYFNSIKDSPKSFLNSL